MSGQGIKMLDKSNTKEDLNTAVETEIKNHGDTAGLNCIDTSQVEDMSDLFKESTFNGDISRWDTSKVTNMFSMFFKAETFDRNISNWNTSKVTNMKEMFYRAKEFNLDLSEWEKK